MPSHPILNGLSYAGLFLSTLISPSISSAQTPILDSSPEDWTVEVVSDDLDYPWDLVSHNGNIFLTEAAGTIVQLEGDQLIRKPLRTSRPIYREGGRGLLGMALAPDFDDSATAYFYHSVAEGDGSINRVIEARQTADGWDETRVLIDDIPGHRLYNGGRIGIGPDGMLYVTTGWTENRQRPQDPESLAGKILRIARDGTVPADNPIAGSLVWSLGHRNPQGLAWALDGTLFAVEHGQSAHDEINLIEAGGNYGWPLIQGGETRSGLIAPWMHSGGQTWAPSGATFAGGELLVAALGAQGLFVADPQTGRLQPVASTGERYRDVEAVGEALWVITTNRSPRGQGPSPDRLLRLSRD